MIVILLCCIISFCQLTLDFAILYYIILYYIILYFSISYFITITHYIVYIYICIYMYIHIFQHLSGVKEVPSAAGLQSNPNLAHLNFAAVLSPLVALFMMIADKKRLGEISSHAPKFLSLTATV